MLFGSQGQAVDERVVERIVRAQQEPSAEAAPGDQVRLVGENASRCRTLCR